jgi:hypothetical protein
METVTPDYLMSKFRGSVGDAPPDISRKTAEYLLIESRRVAAILGETERHSLVLIWKAFVILGAGKAAELAHLAIGYQAGKHPIMTRDKSGARTKGGAFFDLVKNFLLRSKPQYYQWYKRYWKRGTSK